MIQQLIAILGSELDLTPEEVADLLWLTLERQKQSQTVSPVEVQAQENAPVTTTSSSREQHIETNIVEGDSASQEIKSLSVDIYTSPQTTSSPTTQGGYVPLSVPDARSVREPLDFIRALKPLLKKVASSTEKIIDEPATVDWIAQTDIWMPRLQPSLESWLELALVIDESDSMILWRHTVNELQQVLKHYGIFRDVRVWGMRQDNDNQVYLRSQTRYYSPKELIDPQNRRLIMLVSDVTDDLWRNPQILSILGEWTGSNPVVILQMLPAWMWSRTALGASTPAKFRSLGSSILNPNLMVEVKRLAKRRNLAQGINLPVITLEPERSKNWSRMLAGQSEEGIPGYVLRADLLAASSAASSSRTITAHERVSNFSVNASPLAHELAGLLAAAPIITMPVVRLIQDTMLDKSTQLQVAEVFLGGLLKPLVKITLETDPEQVQYEFIEGVRSELLNSIPVPDSEKVFDLVSRHVAKRLGKTLREFVAWLRDPSQIEDEEQAATVKPFAKVAEEILQQLGYQFALKETGVSGGEVGNGESAEPPLKTRIFNVATIEIQKTRTFEFYVATLERKSQFLGFGNRWVINRQKQQGTAIIEVLEPGVELELIEIPGGSFMMGAPKGELRSSDSERPLHEVTVLTFLMGRYPITQAQWRVVASWKQVERELNPDPSRFQEPYKDIERWQRPVENVSWEDAQEFCARLSNKTKREYRLPTEAEWEYACCAGTTTPFHFGETISTELANYYGNEIYGEGVTGVFRQETTPVGYFKVANNFGLYDMHGNVWEWCEDDWHYNYENAPTDGSAWLSELSNTKVRRGGSWNGYPRGCRSAYRNFFTRVYRNYDIGVRVVRVAPRTTK